MIDRSITVSGVSGAVLTFSTDLTDAGTSSDMKCVVQGCTACTPVANAASAVTCTSAIDSRVTACAAGYRYLPFWLTNDSTADQCLWSLCGGAAGDKLVPILYNAAVLTCSPEGAVTALWTGAGGEFRTTAAKCTRRVDLPDADVAFITLVMEGGWQLARAKEDAALQRKLAKIHTQMQRNGKKIEYELETNFRRICVFQHL